MVKTISESDASLKNYNKKWKGWDWVACMHACVSLVRWNDQLVERFLCDNELISFIQLLNFMHHRDKNLSV